MAASLFDLPPEIRLQIYAFTFGWGKVMIEVQDDENKPCLLPRRSVFQTQSSRSSQLLRVSKAILTEARPVLYANTTFHVLNRVFAGKLPIAVTDGHACAPHVKQLIWQVDCDMMKHFYPEDLRLDPEDVSRWSSLELRCRADTWRNSFLGEWCDRETFVKGREQMIAYARVFQDFMNSRTANRVNLIENR
ncbi:hypothetical protein LTR40_014275, partial [Exophiala xenobiotica]